MYMCIYDKSLIVAVESDTMETSLIHCIEHCYLCCVTIHGNELVIFPGITLYGNNKYIVLLSFYNDCVDIRKLISELV